MTIKIIRINVGIKIKLNKKKFKTKYIAIKKLKIKFNKINR